MSPDTAETTYESLADLRAALRSDDRGRMLDAADAIRDADLAVDAVTSQDPPVEPLVDAGIIPDDGRGQTAAEQRQRQVDLLEDILAALEGDS